MTAFRRSMVLPASEGFFSWNRAMYAVQQLLHSGFFSIAVLLFFFSSFDLVVLTLY